MELLLNELAEPASCDKRLQIVVDRLKRHFAGRGGADESQARSIARDMILANQAALLLAHSPPEVADAFCASRLGDERGGTFGALPAGTDFRAIVDRAAPNVH